MRWGEPLRQRRDATLALSTAAPPPPAPPPACTALVPHRAAVTLVGLGPEHPVEEGGMSLGSQPQQPCLGVTGVTVKTPVSGFGGGWGSSPFTFKIVLLMVGKARAPAALPHSAGRPVDITWFPGGGKEGALQPTPEVGAPSAAHLWEGFSALSSWGPRNDAESPLWLPVGPGTLPLSDCWLHLPIKAPTCLRPDRRNDGMSLPGIPFLGS